MCADACAGHWLIGDRSEAAAGDHRHLQHQGQMVPCVTRGGAGAGQGTGGSDDCPHAGHQVSPWSDCQPALQMRASWLTADQNKSVSAGVCWCLLVSAGAGQADTRLPRHQPQVRRGPGTARPGAADWSQWCSGRRDVDTTLTPTLRKYLVIYGKIFSDQ